MTIALSALLAAAATQAAGALDAGFGSGGRVVTDLGGNDAVGATAVQPDGKILVVGASNGRIAIARYTPTGALDASFGSGGVATVSFAPPSAASGFAVYGASIALQADGKIVIGSSDTFYSAFRAVRLLANGSLDTGFGDGGRVSQPVTRNGIAMSSVVHKVLALSSGKVWLLGESFLPLVEDDLSLPPGGENRATLVVLNADGTPDAAVGSNGTVNVGRPDPGAAATDVPLSTILDAAEQPSGVVVVGGAGAGPQGSEAGLVIARLNRGTGEYDPGFGTAGRTRLAAALGDIFTSLAVLSDGRLVAAGSSVFSGSNALRLRRFSADGALDTAFAEPVVPVPRQPHLAAAGTALWLATERDLLAGGDMLLRRITASGALDTTFASAGVLTIDFGAIEIASGVAVQGDGKVVVAGLTFGNSGDFAVARVDPAAAGAPPPPPPPPPVPPAPTGLVATATGPSSIALRWADRSTNETGFVVERGSSPAFNPAIQIAITAANATGFIDASVAPRSTYYYRVAAVNGSGRSAPTATVSASTPRR